MNSQNTLFDVNEFTQQNNKEQIEEMKLKPEDLKGIFSMSVNWTFEGLCNLIDNGSIELSPAFQRRNVWGDERKSQLIESIYLGLPIPPIILAEFAGDDNEKRYMVIDGKQRLLTMIGFFKPEKYPYWKETKGKLKKLKIADKLNGLSYEKMDVIAKRILNNSVLPTWTMHNIKQENMDILYHIFYRVNAGAEPLNLQELRQALHQGNFSNYLAEVTKELQPFQEVMGYDKPDERMNDTEYLVRIFGNKFLHEKYKNSLSSFLDETIKYLNKNWNTLEKEIKEYYDKINKAIDYLEKTFEGKKNIARISAESTQFNKAVFEVELFYFAELDNALLTPKNTNEFKENLKQAFSERMFSELFTRGTNGNHNQRFSEFKKIINSSFKAD